MSRIYKTLERGDTRCLAVEKEKDTRLLRTKERKNSEKTVTRRNRFNLFTVPADNYSRGFTC